jgi:type II secretion system protein N
LHALTGVQTKGKGEGRVSLNAPGSLLTGTVDASRAQGTASLRFKDLAVQGGSVTVPIYGTPTPVDLPSVGLGAFELDLQVENGTATFQRLTTNGELQVNGSGTARLDRQLPLSNLNLALKLKVDPALQKRLGMLGGGLSLLPTDPSQPGWRLAKVTGMLGQPQFGAGR